MKAKEVVSKENKVASIGKKIEAMVVVEPSIFDKYRKHINTVKQGYIRDLDYASAMEILRYIQDITGSRIGLNMSCGACMIGLLEMFSRLKDK